MSKELISMKKYNFEDSIHMHLFYYRDIEEVLHMRL